MPSDPVLTWRRVRKLHRSGHISHACLAVADALLWSCGRAGNPEIQVAYARLAALAGVAESTAKAAIKELKRLGVLTWRRTRIRVKWRSLVWRNIYRFLTESDETPADCRPVKKGRGIEGALSPLFFPKPLRTVAEQLEQLVIL